MFLRGRIFYLILYVFCMDYHSGQWSRGYRLMCVTGKKLGSKFHVTSDQCKLLRNTKLYKYLEENYTDKI